MPDTGVADPAVALAVPADEDVLVDLLCGAFQDDAMAAWVFPDAQRRRAILPRFFRVFFRASVGCGGAYTNDGHTAVLLSLPPDAVEPPGMEEALGEAVGEYAPALAEVTRLQAEHRPDRPHQYLSFGAVADSLRGAGLASGLLAPVLERCDRAGVGTYLEASSPGGYGVARRHGFSAFGDEIRVPGGPALRPMWRDAHVPG